MGKINVLDKSISELIAAGEVIERPASIVKELVENSIDAGSSAITIEIKRGGISYIRITDNGSGISNEDISVAFKRHATSKIKVSDDLDNIGTLGFRGEALSSISAVSRLQMTSKTKEAQFGTKIELEAGEELLVEEVGCPTGTTIIVKDLFYNVPARLKFLKKDISEANVISGIVEKLALSHPEISFKLINEHKIKLHTPGNGELISAIHAVLGKEFSSALIPVDYEYNGIRVNGYASNTQNSRTNRGLQHFFVNSRYVKSKTCTVAIEEGYKNSIMIGKYPFCVLNVNVPFNSVDVNVHPAKIEVRFINERAVYDVIYFAIKSAISNNDVLSNAISPMKKYTSTNVLSTFKNEDLEQIKLDKTSQDETVKYNDFTADKSPNIIVNNNTNLYECNQTCDNYQNNKNVDDIIKCQNRSEVNDVSEFNYININSFKKNNNEIVEDIKPVIKLEDTIEDVKETPKNKVDISIRIIGELFKTYILFETDDNFVMLDKHAAHERLLYEKLKKSVLTDEKQLLIKPIVIVLSVDEFTALMSNTRLLNSMGFSFDEFGNNTIAIREVPLVLSKYNVEEIIIDIAVKLSENKKDVSSDIFENLLHSIACRSAIKANDTSSNDELIELTKLVLSNDEIRHCPHGRPIVTLTSKKDIEKRFGRI